MAKKRNTQIVQKNQDLPLRLAGRDGLGIAALDLAQDGACLVLADLRLDAPDLAPPLPEEIAGALHYLDGAAGLRGAGHILRRRIARSLIAQVSGLPANKLRITHDMNGRPKLEGENNGFFLSFSARGPFGLIAISKNPIGVDIEMQIAPEAIPWNLLTESEHMALQTAGAKAGRAFQRLWTAKEAIAKALGLGFTLAPEAIGLSGAFEGNARAISGIIENAGALSKLFRVQYFESDLKFPDLVVDAPSTGGPVVVAACVVR